MAEVGLRAVLEPEIDERAAEQASTSLRDKVEDTLSDLKPDLSGLGSSLRNIGGAKLANAAGIPAAIPFGGSSGSNTGGIRPVLEEQNELLSTIAEAVDEDFVGTNLGGDGGDGSGGGSGILSIIGRAGKGGGSLAPLIAGTLGVGAMGAGAIGGAAALNKPFGRFGNEEVADFSLGGSALGRLLGLDGGQTGLFAGAVGTATSLAFGEGGRRISEMFGVREEVARGQERIVEAFEDLPPLDELLSAESVPDLNTVLSVDAIPSLDALLNPDSAPTLDDILNSSEVPSLDSILDTASISSLDSMLSPGTVPSLRELLNVDNIPSLNSLLDVPNTPTLNEMMDIPGTPTLEDALDVNAVPGLSTILDLGGVPSLSELLGVSTGESDPPRTRPVHEGAPDNMRDPTLARANRAEETRRDGATVNMENRFEIDPRRLVQEVQTEVERTVEQAVSEMERELRQDQDRGTTSNAAGRFRGN